MTRYVELHGPQDGCAGSLQFLSCDGGEVTLHWDYEVTFPVLFLEIEALRDYTRAWIERGVIIPTE